MPSTDGQRAAKSDLLQSVQRACRTLMLFAAQQRPLTAREIADGLGINLTTSYHLINTLESEGFLARDSSRRLRLGQRIGELSAAFQEMLDPEEVFTEFLDELNMRSGETAYLGMWQDDKVVSVGVREGRGGVRVRGLHLGYAEHAYARALGRALLAHRDDAFVDAYLARTPLEPLTPRTATDAETIKARLEQVRRDGVAIEREEFTPGVCCVGIPILGPAGTPVAALSVSVPTSRFDAEEEMLVSTLRDVAASAADAYAAAIPHAEARP